MCWLTQAVPGAHELCVEWDTKSYGLPSQLAASTLVQSEPDPQSASLAQVAVTQLLR